MELTGQKLDCASGTPPLILVPAGIQGGCNQRRICVGATAASPTRNAVEHSGLWQLARLAARVRDPQPEPSAPWSHPCRPAELDSLRSSFTGGLDHDSDG